MFFLFLFSETSGKSKNVTRGSTCSQKIYLLCLSGVEGLLSGAQKPLNDPVTNLQLKTGDPSRAAPLRDRQAVADLLGGYQVSFALSDSSDSSDKIAQAARGTLIGVPVF